MIHEVSGDILLSSAQAIAHGIAPNDNFGQGLALSLREQWPALYKDFRHFCQTRHPEAGSIWVWAGVGGKRVVNLMTQEGSYESHGKPGKASTSHVNHALKELHAWIESEKITSIALPKLATGVGGLEWNDVYPLIKKHLGSSSAQVYLYTTFHKGQKAVEA
jgi:O-acetyl-ADP-ribose deacetylase (regulator of RNase III)